MRIQEHARLSWRRGALAALTAPPLRSLRVGPGGICQTITLTEEMVETNSDSPTRQHTRYEHDQPVLQGVPVMAHLGLTPQSVHALGGYSVQEVVPTELATRITAATEVPTIGIGAGPDCDAQVMVWQDMAAFRVPGGRTPKFVKTYAGLGDELREAASHFAEEVRSGAYPDPLPRVRLLCTVCRAPTARSVATPLGRFCSALANTRCDPA